ncbi:MAG: AAA family ATPase [Phycisphaerales bacterium]
MLTRLDVQNYRGFQSFQMDGLARVNLLVGKNNSGKTALLEAFYLLASGGSPSALTEAAARRGEMISVREGRDTYPDLTHFFFGHELRVGASFCLRADNGYPEFVVRITALDDPSEQGALFDTERDARLTYGVVFEGAISPWGRERGLGVTDKGALLLDPRFRGRAGAGPDPRDVRPALFIPTDSLGPRRLAELWSQVILDARQTDVVEAMRVIEKGLSQIVFLPLDYNYTSYRSANSPWGIVALLDDTPKPIPLGSMGDGMRRLLSLATALSRAGNGVLVIDEVDTGLHYSVMVDMWKLVIETSKRLGIQVFAATHSWDCIEGLGDYCRENPDMACEVAVHKIERSLTQSVTFSGDRIPSVVENKVEIR